MDEKELRTLLAQAAAETTAPGIAASVAKNGVPTAAATGLARLRPPQPTTPGTSYGIASITKTLTAIAVMQLVEQGRLSLDDPAEKYLPIELRVRGKPVTIEHLLSHTSGIPAPGYAEAQIAAITGSKSSWAPFGTAADVLAFLEKAARDWAVSEPGERYFYLNEGYIALGVVVERVSGQKYEEYIERHIAAPLGMRSTSIGSPREPSAAPYTYTPGQGFQEAPQPPYVWSDGGGYSTALDLQRLTLTLLNRGRLGGEEILQPSSVEEMEKPRARLPWQPLGGGEDAYGLGLIINNLPGLGKLIGHSGALPGYSSYMGYSRDQGSTVTLLANTMMPARDYAAAILAAATGRDPWSLPAHRAARTASLLEGEYRGYQGLIAARLRRIGDALLLESVAPRGFLEAVLMPHDLSDPQRPVYAVHARGRLLLVEFRIGSDGAIEMIYERYRLVKRGA